MSVIGQDPHRTRYAANWLRAGDFGFVAERSGSVLGAAWCRVFEEEEREHPQMTASAPELVVAVEPAAEGQGIGSALIEAVLDHARDEGLITMELTVGAHRDRLIEWYQRLGFSQFGRSGHLVLMRNSLAALSSEPGNP